VREKKGITGWRGSEPAVVRVRSSTKKGERGAKRSIRAQSDCFAVGCSPRRVPFDGGIRRRIDNRRRSTPDLSNARVFPEASAGSRTPYAPRGAEDGDEGFLARTGTSTEAP